MSPTLAGDARVSRTTVQGLPCTELVLPAGDRLVVADHGAHVLSWTHPAAGEMFYLSPAALMDGVQPIRGGVPLCFPQFNNRALGQALPKHGLARTATWQRLSAADGADSAQLVWAWQDSESSRAAWPRRFEARLQLDLEAGRLRMGFTVRNTDSTSWPFALALHSYLRVQDVTQVQLQGLQGLRYWDAVQHLQSPELRCTEEAASLTPAGETDRVYEAVPGPLVLRDPGRPSVRLTQSPNMPEVVVWNPAAALCGRLPDMPPEGWRHMLCVEAACINTPVLLAPGESWTGWQALEVLPSS